MPQPDPVTHLHLDTSKVLIDIFRLTVKYCTQEVQHMYQPRSMGGGEHIERRKIEHMEAFGNSRPSEALDLYTNCGRVSEARPGCHGSSG